MLIHQTIAPLAIAPFGTLTVCVIMSLLDRGIYSNNPIGGTNLSVLLVIGLFAFACGLALVFPVLVFVPRLRRPPLWVATIWGALLAVLVVRVFWQIPFSWQVVALFGGMGGASGLFYALAARWLYPERAEGIVSRVT